MRDPLDAWEEFWEIDRELNFCSNPFETNWIFSWQDSKICWNFCSNQFKTHKRFSQQDSKVCGNFCSNQFEIDWKFSQ